jgi:hypothetical protein
MSPAQAYEHLQIILMSAQAEGDNALALRTIELMCKLNGLFDKQTHKIAISQLNDQQIQDLINQLG